MPQLDHVGPEKEGLNTGIKLGKCHKKDDEQGAVGELGKGCGKRKLSREGKAKRLKYNKSLILKKEK